MPHLAGPGFPALRQSGFAPVIQTLVQFFIMSRKNLCASNAAFAAPALPIASVPTGSRAAFVRWSRGYRHRSVRRSYWHAQHWHQRFGGNHAWQVRAPPAPAIIT